MFFRVNNSAAEITKLMSKLRTRVNAHQRKFRSPGGPDLRLWRLRMTVTALVKYERIELNYPRADESRMYAERLISDAIMYGDCHRETMKMATYWLMEPQLVHKLFKVLVPRFMNSNVSFTKLFRLASTWPVTNTKAVLELKGNPFPSLIPDTSSNKNLIHNILLEEAKKAYRAKKYQAIQEEDEHETVPLSCPTVNKPITAVEETAT